MAIEAAKLTYSQIDHLAGFRNRWWIVAASVVGLTVSQGSILLLN
jgi:hypothetical protein